MCVHVLDDDGSVWLWRLNGRRARGLRHPSNLDIGAVHVEGRETLKRAVTEGDHRCSCLDKVCVKSVHPQWSATHETLLSYYYSSEAEIISVSNMKQATYPHHNIKSPLLSIFYLGEFGTWFDLVQARWQIQNGGSGVRKINQIIKLMTPLQKSGIY